MENKKSIHIIFIVLAFILMVAISTYVIFIIKNVPVRTGKVIPEMDLEDVDKKTCEKLLENSFSLSLAYGDYNSICPEKITSLCDFVTSKNDERNNKLYEQALCSGLCDLLKYASLSEDVFNKMVIEWNYAEKYNGSNTVYQKVDFLANQTNENTPPWWRVAVAYRINKDKVNDICDIYSDELKEVCLTNIKTMIGYLSSYENECLDNFDFKK